MNNQKFLLLIAGATTLALCLIIAIRARHHQSYRTVYVNPDQDSALALSTLASWQKKKYITIRDPIEFNSSLDKLLERLQHEPTLSSMQASSLVGAIKGFINAFSSGDYDSYKNFRFPAEFNYTVASNGSNRLNNYFVTIPPLRPISSKFIHYWLSQYKTNKIQAPPDFNEKFRRFLYENSGFNYYSNYFTGVCFDDLTIKIDKYTNQVPRLSECYFSQPDGSLGFTYVTTNFPNLVYADLGENRWRIFDVKPSIQSVLLKEKSVLCASCMIFTRVQCPEETYIPFPVRFYWLNEPQKWLVDDVILANIYSSTNSNYLIVF